MCTPTQLDHTLFRILLYRNDASEILLEATPERFRLPILSVPAQRREAEEITAAIRTSWNLETYALFRLPAAVPPHPFVHDYAVEACQLDKTSPDRMEWHGVAALRVGVFQSPSDLAAIQNSVRRLDQYRHDELPGSFGKPGWLRTVTEWVEAQAAAAGLRLTGAVRQFNASPTFSLVRFETEGSALWFKAVGEPNLHEYSLTRKLATALPDFLPRVLAAQPGWNAWLSVEAEGAHLTEDSPLSDWQRVVSDLAQLQLATFGNALHLINVGCKDARTYALQIHVRPFFDFVAELMDQQNKPTPAPLSRRELRALACDVEESLEHLACSGTPNVLLHMDLNPNNVLVGNNRCTFLDWAEGAVGCPFFSFEYVREHWKKLHGHDAAAEKALLSAYTREWQSVASPATIEAACVQAPLIAAFASAVLHQPWQQKEFSRLASAPYLRGLARRMKRETDVLQDRRAACLP